MDKSIRIVTDLIEQQAETYRYWQSVSNAERMRTTWEFTFQMYRQTGAVKDGQRLQRTAVHIQRA